MAEHQPGRLHRVSSVTSGPAFGARSGIGVSQGCSLTAAGALCSCQRARLTEACQLCGNRRSRAGKGLVWHVSRQPSILFVQEPLPMVLEAVSEVALLASATVTVAGEVVDDNSPGL